MKDRITHREVEVLKNDKWIVYGGDNPCKYKNWEDALARYYKLTAYKRAGEVRVINVHRSGSRTIMRMEK